MRILSLIPGIALIGSVFASPDFESEVAPILESKCLFCHDSESAKGDLDLTTRSLALGHSKLILPGDAEASELFKAVSGPEPEMPKKGGPLSTKQIRILKEWIESGAEWPEGRELVYSPSRDLDWWSLRPIQQGTVDDLTLLGPAPNPVDSFVDAKLKEKNLQPAGRAAPLDLIRRVTYDLTGLPPTPEEIESFLREDKIDPEKAWETLVDRLLASPAYGEKFARHWLDIARYAETHGYDKDKPRNNAWPYRDYVIRSFNEDKPYSRFLQEQVAGDVLFPGDPDGVLGLGFLAAGPWDFIGHWEVGEGKLDGRIAKHLDRDEMISAVFNAFQSTTVQCAQCHHHKFDPIRMEDYYRLHAVFSAVDRADRVYDGLPEKEEKRKQEILSQISELKAEQDGLDSQIKGLLEAKVSGIDRRLSVLEEKYGTAVKPQYGYHSLISSKQDATKWVQLDLGASRGVAEIRIIPAYDTYAGIGAGFGFPVRFRVEVSNDPEFKSGNRLLFSADKEDQGSPGSRTIAIAGDAEPFRYLRITATKLGERKNDYIFSLGEVEAVDEGGAENFALGAKVTALDSIEQGVRWGKSNLTDGIFFRELTDDDALAELHQLRDQRAAIEKATRPPAMDERLAEIKASVDRLNGELKAIPQGQLVYAAATHFPGGGRFTATSGKPREMHLLHRGDLTTPGDLMSPGAPPLWQNAPEVFCESETWSEGEARAELARYLTRPDNPLVWRSIANRLWQWTFSQPLVGTPNDFGRGGMDPTHPELLDFLAVQLRDDPDQSVKSILRLLFTSKTYRRASSHDDTNASVDGNNIYFWRGNRRRLTAEEFRDSILLVTGKLDRKLGGPSFKDFVIEKPEHSPHYEYHLHDPNDSKSFRRTIYRFVVRSQPQPMLTTLDCADPSISVPQRDESTTALQALTQWNHRFVEAMSIHLAARLASEAPETTVGTACRLALGREPNETERKLLTEHLEAHGTESFARVLFNLNAFVYID